MSELTIGSIGTRLDLELRAGNTLGPYTLSFKDSTGAAIDLTGASVSASASLIDEMQTSDVAITVAVTDALNGKIQISFSAASTAGWDATLTDSSSFLKAKKTYAWICNLTDSAGNVRTIFYGLIYIATKRLP